MCASSSSLLENCILLLKNSYIEQEKLSWKSAFLEGIGNYLSAYIIIRQVNWRQGTVFLL